MRRISDVSDMRVAMVGILTGTSTTAVTAIGNAVDTFGFEDCLAVVSLGSVWCTSSMNADVYVKFQECSTLAGSGSLYSDITDGWPCGSFDVGVIQISQPGAVAPQLMYGGVEYLRLNCAGRKRYLRPTAVLTATVANGPVFVPISVSLLLGGPQRSDLVQNASSFATTTRETAGCSMGYPWGTTVVPK